MEQKMYFVHYKDKITPNGQGIIALAGCKEDAVARAKQISGMLGSFVVLPTNLDSQGLVF
jgi:hypothetical protein